MSTSLERLQAAQWVLERNLGWIASAETKVGVLVAVDTAMLGGLGATFGGAALAVRNIQWVSLSAMAASFMLAIGLWCASMAVLPRTKGPAMSLLFFGRIGEVAEADYVNSFKTASADQLLDDWATQIHRNAQIARDKFKWVRYGMLVSFAGILPWFIAMLGLTQKA